MSNIQLYTAKKTKSSVFSSGRLYIIIASVVCLGLLSSTDPVLAHHALSGKIPSNFFEGFISGLAHPVIGLDHFAFVVAIGLLSIGQQNSFLIPAAFVLTAMAGTGIHVLNYNLPFPEIIIACSVVAFGVMLLVSRKPNWLVLAGLGAIAGLFHGYAYGESIVGAQMTPLIAYLAGFSVIQYVVAIGALLIGSAVSNKFSGIKMLRFAGLAIAAIGTVFLTTAITG
ncbi:HupE/UreJ family protein [Chlorogloeopsis sp. ULAP01]|uniref:HupE/UreJ family protein n=1 Tax=Chlorogloeopsis sp. ULAP01 TaxID=3056483 RepID=UPI0025AB357C|nr:HupE/UreJ family protein [Chlorogloeopsis sp. ULAP01]MDM9385655.1 HupE/UreJ family protein [Chlorogloeopsis sp. ULAP01]